MSFGDDNMQPSSCLKRDEQIHEEKAGLSSFLPFACLVLPCGSSAQMKREVLHFTSWDQGVGAPFDSIYPKAFSSLFQGEGEGGLATYSDKENTLPPSGSLPRSEDTTAFRKCPAPSHQFYSLVTQLPPQEGEVLPSSPVQPQHRVVDHTHPDADLKLRACVGQMRATSLACTFCNGKSQFSFCPDSKLNLHGEAVVVC